MKLAKGEDDPMNASAAVPLFFALGIVIIEGIALFGIVYFAARLAIRHERKKQS